MSKSETRQCDACEGTGNAVRVWSLGGMEAPRDCLTCRGTGRISDAMPA